MSEQKENRNVFYYKCQGTSRTYSAPVKALRLIRHFADNRCVEKHAAETSALELLQVRAVLCSFNPEKYYANDREQPNIYKREVAENKSTFYSYCNTPEIIEFINEYVNIWRDNPDDADYVAVDSVDTGNIRQILKPQDFALINAYVKRKLSELPAWILEMCETQPIHQKYWTVQILNTLLINADCLKMNGLTDKLYVCITTVIWNTSLLDCANVESTGDRYFEQMYRFTVDFEQYKPAGKYNNENELKILKSLCVDCDKIKSKFEDIIASMENMRAERNKFLNLFK